MQEQLRPDAAAVRGAADPVRADPVALHPAPPPILCCRAAVGIALLGAGHQALFEPLTQLAHLLACAWREPCCRGSLLQRRDAQFLQLRAQRLPATERADT